VPARRHQLTTAHPFAFAAGTLATIAATAAAAVALPPGLAANARDTLGLQLETSAVAPDARVVLLHNARPVVGLLLGACVASRLGRSRIVLDVAVIAFISVNAILIGVALGAYGAAIAARLAHVPLEYAALTVAGGSYLAHRHQPPRVAPMATTAVAALTFVAAGALVEANTP
jgi:hypothetical protein